MIDFDIPNLSLMIAQEGQAIPPLPGEAAPIESTPGTGAPNAAPGGGAPPAFGMDIIFFVMILVVVMILFSVMGQRRERKKREAMISAVKKHDRVQTIGGVIGSVVEVKPDHIVLKVDESSNTRITFSRSAVQQVLTSSPELSREKSEPLA